MEILNIFPFQVIYRREGYKNTMKGRANVPTRTHLIALRARVNALSNALYIVFTCIVVLPVRNVEDDESGCCVFFRRVGVVVSRSIALIWRCYISGPPQ